jgi:hypothetical protein
MSARARGDMRREPKGGSGFVFWLVFFGRIGLAITLLMPKLF